MTTKSRKIEKLLKDIDKFSSNSDSDSVSRQSKVKQKIEENFIFEKSNSTESTDESDSTLHSEKQNEKNSTDSNESEEEIIESEKQLSIEADPKLVWYPSLEYEAVHKIYEYFSRSIPFTTILSTIHQSYGNLEEAVLKLAKGEITNGVDTLLQRPLKGDKDRESQYYC